MGIEEKTTDQEVEGAKEIEKLPMTVTSRSLES